MFTLTILRLLRKKLFLNFKLEFKRKKTYNTKFMSFLKVMFQVFFLDKLFKGTRGL